MDGTSLSHLDKFREWVRTLAGGIFSAPYLPVTLTAFFITTIITHLAVFLMSPPFSYWDNSKTTSGFIAFVVLYILIITMILVFVTYRISLILWFIAEFWHIFLIQEALSKCYISRWSPLFSEALCQTADYGMIWVIAAIIVGILLAFTFQPAEFPIENKIIKKGISFTAGLIPAAWIALMFIGVIISAQKPTTGWIPLNIKEGPGPLQEAEAAYDIQRGRLVVFGGQAKFADTDQWGYKTETWEWDGNQWLNVKPSATPPGRSYHSLAYDEKRGVTVLFGGHRSGEWLSDTWEWDGKSWKEMNPANIPPLRSGQKSVYDRVREKVVIYGGYDGKTFYNDAWEWDGTNWTRIQLKSGAPTANGFMLAYDPEKNFSVSYMGGTWTWEQNTWTHIYPAAEPPTRSWTTLVYDQKRKLFFMFGGATQEKKVNDTWVYDGTTWQEFTIGSIKPSARVAAVIWYDPIREHVMLFGGNDDDNTFSDMWEFIPPEE